MYTLNKMRKICLIGATFDTNNMGVSALTVGMIKCFMQQFPEAQVYLLNYGKERKSYEVIVNNRVIPVKLLNMRFSKKLYLKNNILVLILIVLALKIIPLKNIKKRIVSQNYYLNNIFNSNIISSIAGGDSFSDIYGLKQFLYVALPQLLVLFMNKDLSLAPQTFGPFKRNITKLIAKYILNHSKLVYSRDYTGLQELEKFLGAKFNSNKFRFCYDVGFVLDPIRPGNYDSLDFATFRKKNKFIVGLNVSGLLYMGGYTGNNMFGLKVDYRELLCDVIDFVVNQQKASIVLVPHVFGSKSEVESDSVVCDELYKDLKNKYNDKISVIKGTFNQNEIKYIIGQCDFFIGSRMHSCIAALSQNIPTVSIAYSKKFFGVMETIDAESLVADPCKENKNEIINIIAKSFDQRDSIREKLKQKMPEVKETVLNLFNENSSV